MKLSEYCINLKSLEHVNYIVVPGMCYLLWNASWRNGWNVTISVVFSTHQNFSSLYRCIRKDGRMLIIGEFKKGIEKKKRKKE